MASGNHGGRSTFRGPSAWGGGGTGGGGGAPTDAGYVVTAMSAGLSAETLIGSIILPSDIAANRPAATSLVAGTIFFATDTQVISRADGLGAWVAAITPTTLAAGTRWAPDVVTVPGTAIGNVTLSTGLTGGDTLTGGIAASENLVLSSTAATTKGSVLILDTDPTYVAAPAALFGTSSARIITANYASQKMPTAILFAGTRVMTTAGNSGALPNIGIDLSWTYKNASGVAANLAAGSLGASTHGFSDRTTVTADAAALVGGVHISFSSGPTFTKLTTGTFSSLSYTGFVSSCSLNDVAITNIRGFQISNPTVIGIGATTNMIGIEIAALTAGTTENTGIKNNATLRQIGLANFGSDTAPTYGIHMRATTGDAGSIHLAEVTTAPTNPASSTGVVIYHKADKMVMAFNIAGTMRYHTYDLTQTATAIWASSATAP